MASGPTAQAASGSEEGKEGSSENSDFVCVLEGNDALSLSSAEITRLCALASVMLA